MYGQMRAPARKEKGTPWVLVVDDDPVAARATARAVSRALGVRFSFVSDAPSAVRLVSHTEEAPAAVLLDFELRGGETGVTVLSGLRAAGCQSPCAFHTGAPGRARAALAAARLVEGHPVFDKAPRHAGALAEWVARAVADGAGTHVSGVRRRLG
jgi:CheY-like chemotaxis protein